MRIGLVFHKIFFRTASHFFKYITSFSFLVYLWLIVNHASFCPTVSRFDQTVKLVIRLVMSTFIHLCVVALAVDSLCRLCILFIYKFWHTFCSPSQKLWVDLIHSIWNIIEQAYSSTLPYLMLYVPGSGCLIFYIIFSKLVNNLILNLLSLLSLKISVTLQY